MKVVRLLQDTKAELENELDDDKAVYEKMTCWCNSNDTLADSQLIMLTV